MSDIATLGIAIDSRPVTAAVKALDDLTRSAKPATAAASALESAMKPAANGTAALTKQTGLARYELINLSRQIQDVGVSLVSGQSPFLVLAQQGTQIADIFASSKDGTVRGALRQVAGGIASVITPARALGVGFAATTAVLAGSLASWKTYALRLDDVSHLANTTVGNLARLQSAASFKGIDGGEFNKAIERFSQSIYDAKNNMGGLADVFRANNVHASTFDDYLGKAADLIQRSSGDTAKQFSLLQQMGLPATAEWVRLLSSGAAGIEAAKAAALGFAADDSLIRSARAFDEAINKASTNFTTGWRNATVNVVGMLESISSRGTSLLMSLPGVGKAVPSNILRNALNDVAAGYNVGSRLTAGSDVGEFYKGIGAFDQKSNGGGAVDPAAAIRSVQLEQPMLALVGVTPAAPVQPAKQEKNDSDQRRLAA